MKVNAFIFARGGSKGLPRKNVKSLLGKPLIQYSIEIAQQIDVDNVFVSTDDEEISNIANRLGAQVIHRPPELATDTCSEWLAWRHAVEYVSKNHGNFDLFVSLPPTSPLRSTQDVSDAINLLNFQNADICISTSSSNRSPFFNMVKKDSQGLCELINKLESKISRRQDAPQVYDITTVVYVTKPEYILHQDNLFSGKVVSVDIPKERAVDIDDIYDFMLAEAILKFQDIQYAQ